MKGDIQIGYRADEELRRISEERGITMKKLLRIGNIPKSVSFEWSIGTTPGTGYLQRLHYLGADVIYILTGRKRNDSM